MLVGVDEADPMADDAEPLTPLRERLSPAGRKLAAGMLGLDQAIYGERPKVEIVEEADRDGLDLGDVDLDADDPAASRMTIDPE